MEDMKQHAQTLSAATGAVTAAASPVAPCIKLVNEGPHNERSRGRA